MVFEDIIFLKGIIFLTGAFVGFILTDLVRKAIEKHKK